MWSESEASKRNCDHGMDTFMPVVIFLALRVSLDPI